MSDPTTILLYFRALRPPGKLQKYETNRCGFFVVFLNVENMFRNNVLRFLGHFGGSLWVPGGKLFSVFLRAGFLVKKEANRDDQDEQGRSRQTPLRPLKEKFKLNLLKY